MSVLDDIFSGFSGLVKTAGSLAPTAASWKELIDPVKAVQQPTLGTGAGTPIIAPTPGAVSKTPGVSMPMTTTVWVAVGGIAIVLLFLIMSKRN